jgi:hypothetical protein
MGPMLSIMRDAASVRATSAQTRWTEDEDRMLMEFLVRFAGQAESRMEALTWAAFVLRRSVSSVMDREESLRAPSKQRTSHLFPGLRLYGSFTTGYRRSR